MQIGFILRDAKILILRAVLTDIHSDMIRAGRVFKYQKRHLNLSCLRVSLMRWQGSVISFKGQGFMLLEYPLYSFR